MTGFAVCNWEETANRLPVVYRSTHDLDSATGNYSGAEHVGAWVV